MHQRLCWAGRNPKKNCGQTLEQYGKNQVENTFLPEHIDCIVNWPSYHQKSPWNMVMEFLGRKCDKKNR
jgi:hypothetical protein